MRGLPARGMGLGAATMLLAAHACPALAQHHDKPPLAEIYLPAYLDNFDLSRNDTFPLRVLLDDGPSTHASEGPLVVYTGNEGDIEDFVANTGAVFTLAAHLGGRAAFVEQRFYGKSTPPGQAGSYHLLSSEQVLADLARTITTLRRRFGSPAVVAVGGSYGGMLSAWLQRQHPGLIDAAWAASAPLRGFADTLVAEHRQGDLYAIVERSYTDACAATVKSAFHNMVQRSSPVDVARTFRLCRPNSAGPADVVRLVGYLQKKFSELSMFNYPYPVNFSGHVLPANPPRVACSKIATSTPETSGATVLREALEWYYNASAKDQSAPCLELEPFEANYPGLIDGPWTYQRCTDLVMAYSVEEDSKMFVPCSEFPSNCWDEERMRSYCAAQFEGMATRRASGRSSYFSPRWDARVAPRVVLTNGRYDPWGYGGVGWNGAKNSTPPQSNRSEVIWIEESAHHFDLRWPNKKDPQSVTNARARAFKLITAWVSASE